MQQGGGFLSAIDDRQGCKVQLGGESVYVERARLGEHLQLAAIAQRFDKAESADDKAAALNEYFKRMSIDTDGATPGEIILAFVIIRALNQWHEVPAWLDPDKAVSQNDKEKPRSIYAPNKRPLPYAYAGRFWTFWIHKIASSYHWPRKEIYNLWPEEAAYYIQEILLSEFEEREDRRALSQLSYKVDKNSGIGRFVPSPKPPWMVDEAIPEKVIYQKSMLPVGSVESSYTSELFKNGNGAHADGESGADRGNGDVEGKQE